MLLLCSPLALSPSACYFASDMQRRSFFRIALGAAVACSAGLPTLKAVAPIVPTVSAGGIHPDYLIAQYREDFLFDLEQVKRNMTAISKQVWEERHRAEYLALASS